MYNSTRMKTFLLSLLLLFVSIQLLLSQPICPKFKMFDLDKKPVTEKIIKWDKNAIFVFFDPGCEHCESQASWIKADLSKFSNCNFYFVSISDPNQIKLYRDRFFKGNKQVTFLFDKDYATYKTFLNISNTPTVVIYSKDKKKKIQFDKETPAADLLKYL